jgi:uncharacterized membrane protein
MRLLTVVGFLSIPFAIKLGNLLKEVWLSDDEIQVVHNLLIYFNIVMPLQAWFFAKKNKLESDELKDILRRAAIILVLAASGFYLITVDLNGMRDSLLICTGMHMLILSLLLIRNLVRLVK